jgi:hypothetical protein
MRNEQAGSGGKRYGDMCAIDRSEKRGGRKLRLKKLVENLLSIYI